MNKITDIVISRDSFVSLHSQLHNQLRQFILSQRWPYGSQIPSETEFAEHLQLSRSTVRLALQQAEIEGLIERKVGRGTFVCYRPSRERKNRLIAFLTCDFATGSHLLMLNGAETEIKARGYQTIFSRAENYEDELRILKSFEQDDIEGVLLWANAAHSHEGGSQRIRQLHLPIVLVDRMIQGFDCDCVSSDNYGGGQVLMRHLIEVGHQHIVFVCHHEMAISTVVDRYQAYCDAMQEAKLIPVDAWLISRPGSEPGIREVLRSSTYSRSPEIRTIRELMLNAQPRPTAIWAVNDYAAILCMRAMKSLDLKIPDAVSIAGFDDEDLAIQLEVPLTTVAQDPFMIGRRAAQFLIDRIEGYGGPARSEAIPTQLRVRSSTSSPTPTSQL